MQAPCLKINKTPNQDRSRRATKNSTGQIGMREGVKAKALCSTFSENNGKAPSSKKKKKSDFNTSNSWSWHLEKDERYGGESLYTRSAALRSRGGRTETLCLIISHAVLILVDLCKKKMPKEFTYAYRKCLWLWSNGLTLPYINLQQIADLGRMYLI